ncbi:MAG: hypothetical protein KJN85_00300 [Maribacter sp.]|nr:hypothetical protein [Maribacter sp.]MBT8314454.1 hypothetical protein [Maribacter sp.]
MPHILKNINLEVHIDLPEENYNFSRFDWSGKIAAVNFQNIPLTIAERTDIVNNAAFGKGFYNEFGIDNALGFEEAPVGGWFHKIGVGLLKKEDDQYLFHKQYEIKPAQFEITTSPNTIVINCTSEVVHGYAYVLRKEIVLEANGFAIKYTLQNTGDKEISTDEYVHNFLAINKALMGIDYELKFPFRLKPELFDDTVNKEQQVVLGPDNIGFKGTPNEQFFFSNLSGSDGVVANWELLNHQNKIGISEMGDFKTNKVNLWGWKHVISPELFIAIHLQPGQSMDWSRMYNVFRME